MELTVVVEVEHNNKLITEEFSFVKVTDLPYFSSFDRLLESIGIHRQVVVFEDNKDGVYINEYIENL
jgi:hypothetical protein